LLATAPRIAFTITGRGIFLATPMRPVNVCDYVREGPRVLDIEKVVRDFLSSNQSGSLADLDLSKLANLCVAAVQVFLVNHQDAGMVTVVREAELFQVVLASYDSEARISTVRNFAVTVSDSLVVQSTSPRMFVARPETPSDYWAFGETEYTNQYVIGGIGQQFLGSVIPFLLVERPVRDISRDTAAQVAIDLIEATSKTTALVQAPSGIGGPVDVAVIDERPSVTKLQWKASREP
jgi:hypothetical protein